MPRFEPVLRNDLPALLGRRTPSGLPRVADAAGRCRLHVRGNARDMLPVIVDACCIAIEDDTRTEGEWVEVGYRDGGVDWAWRETIVYGDAARSLIPLRAMVSGLIDLIDLIDDLVAAQRDVGELLS